MFFFFSKLDSCPFDIQVNFFTDDNNIYISPGTFENILMSLSAIYQRFLTNIFPLSFPQSLEGLKDGDSAHFECTLTPVNDPELKVEWFHNGKPIFHKNRVKMVSDFGFVVMDIAYVQSHDSGEYVCRAWNK